MGQLDGISSSRARWGGLNGRPTPTDLLPVAEPQVHTQLVRPRLLYVEVEVLKALDELSAGPLYGDDTGLRREFHAFGDVHITRGQQGLHGGRTLVLSPRVVWPRIDGRHPPKFCTGNPLAKLSRCRNLIGLLKSLYGKSCVFEK